ncbi:MAG: zinc ribbon domain-containing protein [Aeriscardovia sp.]|nr:zinc ribbon domain-containing protein [Aeriscardovia sp.]
MPFCHNCGAKLEPGDMFCVECGTKSKEFLPDEGKTQTVTASSEKEEAVFTPAKEAVVESKSEPDADKTIVMPPIVESVVESQPVSEPEIEEVPVQSVDEGNFFTEFHAKSEENIESKSKLPVEDEKVAEVQQDIEKKAEEKPTQVNNPSKNNLIPLLVTISGVCVALVIALIFAILIVLKSSKKDKENKSTVQTSDFYVETTTAETTTESITEVTTTEETEDTEETQEDTEETEEDTEDPETQAASKDSSAKPKFKVSNAVNKKQDAAQYGTYVYKVPKITISGLNTDETNKKIKDDLSEYYGVSGEPYEVKYTYYSNKQFVVILVDYSRHRVPGMNRVYTISLKTGKIMTGSEIVKIYGITDKHFFKQVRTTYNKCYFGTGDSTSASGYRSKNLNRVSYKYVTPYIGKTGHLCFVGYCDFAAIEGSGYLNFDATAKKMLATF